MDEGALGPVARALRAATEEAVRGEAQVSVLFSGGLDSSIVATLARRTVGVHLVTVGTRGSADREAATEGAGLLGVPISVAEVDEPALRERLAEEKDGLARIPRPLWGVALGLAIGVERCPDPVVLCGQGADELFYGYAHFRGLTREEMAARADDDWRSLVERDWPWATGRARSLGHDLRSPFLAASVVAEARRLAPEPIPAGGPSKRVLRRVAAIHGVPAQISNRPKRAFQYGSGIERLLRRLDAPSDKRRTSAV